MEILNSRGFDYRRCGSARVVPFLLAQRREAGLGRTSRVCLLALLSTFLPLVATSVSPLRKVVAGLDLGLTTSLSAQKRSRGYQ